MPHSSLRSWTPSRCLGSAVDGRGNAGGGCWPTRRPPRGRSAIGCAGAGFGGDPATVRSTSRPPQAWQRRRTSAGVRQGRLPAAQRRRTLHQPPQTMAWPGHAHRRTRRTLPGRTHPRRDPALDQTMITKILLVERRLTETSRTVRARMEVLALSAVGSTTCTL